MRATSRKFSRVTFVNVNGLGGAQLFISQNLISMLIKIVNWGPQVKRAILINDKIFVSNIMFKPSTNPTRVRLGRLTDVICLNFLEVARAASYRNFMF